MRMKKNLLILKNVAQIVSPNSEQATAGGKSTEELASHPVSVSVFRSVDLGISLLSKCLLSEWSFTAQNSTNAASS